VTRPQRTLSGAMNKIRIKILLIALIFALTASSVQAQPQTYPAQVKDISNRAYYPAICYLIENAQKSIYIGSYIIAPSQRPTHPVNRLLDALKQAAKRGVKVKIYLNTRQTFRYDPQDIPGEPWIKDLIGNGIEIIFADPGKTLHDKLMVIDEEIVIDGSANWAEASFNYNFESATLIYSKPLAMDKLKLLEEIEIYSETHRKTRCLFPYPVPDRIRIPRTFIEDKRFLTNMNARKAERALKLYLLIQYIYQSYPEEERQDGIILNIDLCAPYLGISPEWTRANIRRQTIVLLRRLKSKYCLIDVRFHSNRPIWVKPLDLGGGDIAIEKETLGPEDLKVLSRKQIIDKLQKIFLDTNP